MTTLLINTAAPGAWVALAQGEEVLAHQVIKNDDVRGEQVLTAGSELLARVGLKHADLAIVAAQCGPGRYSSLRVGLTTASVLADALGLSLKQFFADELQAAAMEVAAAEAVATLTPRYK